MDAIRKSLPTAVLTALRRWYTGPQESHPWGEMLVVALRLAESPVPKADLAVKEVVLDGLNQMEAHAAGEFAQILRVRFLDVRTAAETANRLNLTQDIVYKRQRRAIRELADTIWQAELEARWNRDRRIAGRLETKEPPRLFGIRDKLAELVSTLTAGSPWLVALVGIGGIGKTSLADAAVRALASRPDFSDIAWVSARQERFTLWEGLQSHEEGTPALTVEGLVDTVIEQFGFQDLRHYPLAQKQEGLRARLKTLPHLVVVDNLETAADYRNLIPELQGLVNPTKFLLTSRRSLHGYPGVHNLSLDELSAQDSLALVRHEARERGQAEVVAAPDETLLQVYEVAGGNPLALKLLVGQMQVLSLSRVVHDLREARGQKVEGLYRFIYWHSWGLLSHEARRVLAIMPMVAESGGGLEQILVLSELSEEQMMDGLQQLASLSLVNVLGTLSSRRYSIHRLTETFLLNEVLRWERAS